MAKLIAPHACRLPTLRLTVKAGDEVDVPEDVAVSLREQGWRDVDGPLAGSVAEVKDWVGDDIDRARTALAAEQAALKPRTSLVGWLEDLIADATTQGDQPETKEP